ncbi:serine/threonine-protein kinase [Thermocatellispora tengchongensis]|uniref:serine/threonine-protein kinase n=1 Tax=Thermocatellispora tengchongensis TaxID=1073253 RepID=UPI00362FC335
MPTYAELRQGDPLRLGGYELRGRLGHGGQGVVYLGAGADGELVAVKWLRPDLSGDQVVMERFLREAATAQRVAAFCTARVLAMGIEQDRPYIVSEYVDGPSLQAVVAEEGPRDGVALHRLAIGTATALAAIHQAGIVHRDFKPANVLLARDGPRVIDFGISRALDATSTLSSAPVGTPAYMAPEQFLGQKAGPAADMFAWAGTMIYAATGKAAFGSDSLPAVLNRVLNGEPEHLSRLDGRLRELVEACLAKDPDERPTAEEVILGLLRHEVPGPRVLLEGAAAAGTSSRVGEDHTSADDGGPAGGGTWRGRSRPMSGRWPPSLGMPVRVVAGGVRCRWPGVGCWRPCWRWSLVVALVNRGDGGGARAGADATPSAVAAVPTGG